MAYYTFQPVFSVPSLQFLVMNVQLSGVSTGAQLITQLVPSPVTTTQGYAETTFVITQAIFRNNSGSAFNAGTTFSMGWAEGVSTVANVISANALLQSSAGITVVHADASSATGKPGNFLTITMGGTLTSNPTFQLDVIGYFTTVY